MNCFISTARITGVMEVARHAPLAFPTLLLVAASTTMVASVVELTRMTALSWSTFRTVFKWALCASVVVAAMIEFAFVHDHTRGGATLVMVSVMLMNLALSVPMNIAFTAARFAPGAVGRLALTRRVG